MGEYLPDGSYQHYQGYCKKCGEIVNVNIQGDPINHHMCNVGEQKDESLARQKPIGTVFKPSEGL